MFPSMYWRRKWQPTPVFLPGDSYGQRRLAGYSPWGHEQLGMTEHLHFHFSLSCIGEGNGNPLQYSCLEIPRDRRAWWAAVYGVTQSWTRLKRLSRSSSSSRCEGTLHPLSDSQELKLLKYQMMWLPRYMHLGSPLHHILTR